jgi:hypothetical protein
VYMRILAGSFMENHMGSMVTKREKELGHSLRWTE